MGQSNLHKRQKGTLPLPSSLAPQSRIFIHGQSAVPYALINQVAPWAKSVDELEYFHLHVEGKPAHLEEAYRSHSRINNLFVSPSVRKLMDFNKVDYTPLFLSEIPVFIRSGRFPIDIALIHVSEPDQSGYCSLGVGVDIARAACDSARMVFAQINSKMPRTHGDTLVHMDRIDYAIEVNEPLPQSIRNQNDESLELEEIGRNVASLIEDGSTLQIGIGAIPDKVLSFLKNHKHLGIHSEMWSDGVAGLIKNGVVDNSKKIVHPGKTISSFIQGTQASYDFVHNNHSVELYPSDYVNSPMVIARNPKVVAINSAVEVDLTGQVCADSVGHHMISGVGGQLDFVRGAAMSPDGKSIFAMTSRTRAGASRIVFSLHEGAGVVTTRADVHFVVTEYGIADLYGKSLGQRAKLLISIAHPEDRDALTHAWHRACTS